MDVVVTKPGYGIIADCVANHTAMLYTERGRFVEYDVLVREMPRYLRCEFIDLDSFLTGRWRDRSSDLIINPRRQNDPAPTVQTVVADLIVERLTQ